MSYFNISILKKLLSYIHPQRIAKLNSTLNPDSELLLHKGQLVLCTKNAIYSDGIDYAPFKISFESIFKNTKVSSIKSFLLLGGGICSANIILNQYNKNISHTIVELDESLIQVSKQLLQDKDVKHYSILSMDALHFLQNNISDYDLIGVDIFKDLSIPQLFLGDEFMQLLLNAMHNNSIVIFNWLNNTHIKGSYAYTHLKYHFKNVQEIEYGKNIFIIASSPTI